MSSPSPLEVASVISLSSSLLYTVLTDVAIQVAAAAAFAAE